MILYQMAKSMEQRSKLERSIRESGGDVTQMMNEKAEIEQSMLLQAMKWQEADPSALAASGVE